MTCRDGLGSHRLSNTYVAEDSKQKFDEQNFRACSSRFGFLLRILTIVFDIRPSVCREICAGGYGWAAVFQKKSWTEIIVDHGPVQKSKFRKFNEILTLAAPQVRKNDQIRSLTRISMPCGVAMVILIACDL